MHFAITSSSLIFLLAVATNCLEYYNENDIPELIYMDQSIDPCDDFYGHVCANFPKYHPLTGKVRAVDNYHLLEEEIVAKGKSILEAPITKHEPEALKKAKAAYKSCINYASFEKPELETIKEFGGMPMLGYPKTGPTPSIWQQIGRMTANYGIPLLFNIQVGPLGLRENVIVISVDGILNPNYIRPKSKKTYEDILRQSFLDVGKPTDSQPETLESSEDIMDLNQFMLRTANKLANPAQRNTLHIAQDLAEMVKFTKPLLSILEGKSDNASIKLPYPTTLRQLQDWTDQQLEISEMDWYEYLGAVFSKSGAEFTDDTNVYVDYNHVYSLLKLVQNTDRNLVENFAFTRIFLFQAPDSDATSRSLFEAYYKYRKYPMEARSDYCAEKVLDVVDTAGLNFAVAYEYHKLFFNTNKFKETTTMLSKVKSAYRDSLLQTDWMDSSSREAALRKLDNLIILLGYPEMVTNATAVTAFYENLQICRHDNYQNAKNVRAFRQAYQWSQLNPNMDRTFWGKSTFEVNAYYNRPNNKIVLPVAILNGVFLGNKPALDYSRLGSIVGHEITHGFDERGSNYNEDGLLEPWWSNFTIKAFNDRTQCFKNEYSRFEFQGTNGMEYVNGNTTVNENIADNGGIRQAFKAFLNYTAEYEIESDSEQYTLEQLFFLGFGTMWCSTETPSYMTDLNHQDESYSPNKYRVNGVVSNSVEFSRAFNCPLKTSAMNPETKCQLW